MNKLTRHTIGPGKELSFTIKLHKELTNNLTNAKSYSRTIWLTQIVAYLKNNLTYAKSTSRSILFTQRVPQEQFGIRKEYLKQFYLRKEYFKDNLTYVKSTSTTICLMQRVRYLKNNLTYAKSIWPPNWDFHHSTTTSRESGRIKHVQRVCNSDQDRWRTLPIYVNNDLGRCWEIQAQLCVSLT